MGWPAGALLLLSLLAACTAAPPRVPRQLPPPAWVAMPDGERLALHAWFPNGPAQAAILALHGFGDSGELTFARAAEEWVRQGIAVYAPDLRGFGANPSRRDWPGAGRLAADAVSLAAAVRQRHPGLRLTVVGHSMGAGVALLAAARGLPADRLVLAAPAITGGAAIPPLARGFAAAVAAVAPDYRWTGRGIVEISPTDNLPALIEVARDPRSFGDATSREIRGLIEVMDLAAAAAGQDLLPTLTLMGAQDMLIDPGDVRDVVRRLPCSAGYLLYPDGWHWLFRDLQAPRVWADVAVLAKAHLVRIRQPALAGGADAARCAGA